MITLDKKNEILSEFILTNIDMTRLKVSEKIKKEVKSELGQFFTEPRLALFMSSLFEKYEPHVKILDPGAGIGALTSALITTLCKQKVKPLSIEVTAIEIDGNLLNHLARTLEFCKRLCQQNEVDFAYSIVHDDFINYGVSLLKNNVSGIVNKVIMNPPYKKINSGKKERKLLREVNIETTNLYTAFVAIAKRLLIKGGELVAITPRSFCNGTYFRPFRYDFLEDMSFRAIHLFESRSESFKDDDVLQENIIFHAIKTTHHNTVTVSSSPCVDGVIKKHIIDYDKLIVPSDPEKFIRILVDEIDLKINKFMSKINNTLEDLNLSVSTGRVVDFRTKENLRDYPDENTVPLIYPVHFKNGSILWPAISTSKPNAILVNDNTKKLFVKKGNYVLVRRFSSKEEKKRIVATVYNENIMDSEFVGFENHINYFHRNGGGIPLELAKGLALYLSSSTVDRYFRQFSGHTQVNVGDLKSMPYPSEEKLVELGEQMKDYLPEQAEIDRLVYHILGIS